MKNENITDTFISGHKVLFQNISLKTIEQVKKCLLDYLGVATAGRQFLNEKHPELISNVPSDVFLNGFAAHV